MIKIQIDQKVVDVQGPICVFTTKFLCWRDWPLVPPNGAVLRLDVNGVRPDGTFVGKADIKHFRVEDQVWNERFDQGLASVRLLVAEAPEPK